MLDTFYVGMKRAVSPERFSFGTERIAAPDSSSLQSQLVDSAISRIACNLPAEVTRVTALQRHQTSLITNLQQELRRAQKQSREAGTRVAERRAEMERLLRHNGRLEMDSAATFHCCLTLKNDILALSKDCDEKRKDLSSLRLQSHATKSRLAGYTRRLQHVTASVGPGGRDGRLEADIRRVEQRVAALKETEARMLEQSEGDKAGGGTGGRHLQATLHQLNVQSDQLSEDMKQLQQKVDRLRSQQEQVKVDTAVLHKRNAAQLLRLKQTLREQTLHHRQWTDQAAALATDVTALGTRLHDA